MADLPLSSSIAQNHATRAVPPGGGLTTQLLSSYPAYDPFVGLALVNTAQCGYDRSVTLWVLAKLYRLPEVQRALPHTESSRSRR